jgi:hypothetical protein
MLPLAAYHYLGYNFDMDEYFTLRLERVGTILKEWVIPEYTQHERSRTWYTAAGMVCLILIVLSLWTPNYFFDSPNILFVSIIILTAVTLVARHIMSPHRLAVVIYEDGLAIGDQFFPYKDLADFAVVYEPPEVKMLYFHFKKFVRPRLPVPLLNENPIEIREILLRYLEENLERENEPTSDALGRWLKL